MSESRSEGSSLAIAVVLLLLALLLVAVVAGVAFFFYRAQRVAMEQARAQEMVARLEAERAMAASNAVVESRRSTIPPSPEVPPPPEGNLVTAVPAEVGAAETESIRNTIEGLLREQESAWNAHDVERFMEYYWRSDRLSFSSSGDTIYGWNQTLERYRARYPDSEAMGKLKLDQLEVTPLGTTAAMVLGQWALDREKPVSGRFTLVLRRINGRWLIVHDHTSQRPL